MLTYPPLLLFSPSGDPARTLLSYSSEFQHDRKNGHVSHSLILCALIMNSLPEAPLTPRSAMCARHGGISDLHPCLLSQLMQYPVLGFMSSCFLRQAEGPIGWVRPSKSAEHALQYIRFLVYRQ